MRMSTKLLYLSSTSAGLSTEFQFAFFSVLVNSMLVSKGFPAVFFLICSYYAQAIFMARYCVSQNSCVRIGVVVDAAVYAGYLLLELYGFTGGC